MQPRGAAPHHGRRRPRPARRARAERRAVEAVRKGRQYFYKPAVARSQYVHAESKGLLDRLFDGRISPLVAHFSEHDTLTPEDIAELKTLIARIETNG